MAFKIEYAKTMAEKILKYMVQYMFNTTIRDMCADDPWWSHVAWSCLDYFGFVATGSRVQIAEVDPKDVFCIFFDATVVHTMQAGNERSKSFKIHRLASTEALNQPQNDLDDDEEPIRWSIDSPIMSSCPIHLNMSQTSAIGIWLACIALPWYCAILSCKLIRWKVEDIA